MHDVITPPAAEDPQRQLLAEALEEYHRRTSVGEPVDLSDFRERLGERYARLERVIEAERALDDVMSEGPTTSEAFPRPFGPFTLLSELGHGGMGVVYEALERSLGRRVALKVLHTRFAPGDEAYQRFDREAKLCARIKHDHVVCIHSHGMVEGRAYYAMDLVEGAPLSRLVSHGLLPAWPALAGELAGVADALASLHAAQVIHRDVKPQNIVVRKSDGRMILVDFGLARHAEDATLTRSGGVVGTPAYMSPEQILGQSDRVCPATDMYGLGATLYECLAGQAPFRALEYPALIEMIRSSAPVWPHVSSPGVPPGLERIAIKALYKEPNDRYASAAAMAHDLRLFAAGEEPQGRLLSRLELGRRWLTKRWKPLAAAAVVLVGLAFFWARRPATLVLEATAPGDAIAWVDHEERGRPPLKLSVSPGEHHIELRRAGFRSVERVVSVAAGAEHTAEFKPLRPNRGAGEERPDPETLAAYGRALAELYGLPTFDEDAQATRSGTRGGGTDEGSATLTVIAPRGRVRPSDLTHWWVELDVERFTAGGRFELRQATREGGEVLWTSEPFEPQSERDLVGRIHLSAAAQARLQPGANLTFAYVPAPAGAATPQPAQGLVSLELVALDAAAASLARLDRAGAETLAEATPALGVTLRAAALRAEGLHTAALHQVTAALRAEPADLFAQRTLRGVLREAGLGASDLVRLTLAHVDTSGAGLELPPFGAR